MWVIEGPEQSSTEIAGSLDLQPNAAPVGVVHGSLPIELGIGPGGENSMAFPQRVEMDTLVAHLANGMAALLVNAQVEYWVPNQGLIVVSAAIVGTHKSLREANPNFQGILASYGGCIRGAR